MTVVINLFGAPSTGKSTLALGETCLLKQCGVSVEMASEYAKELVWDNDMETLGDQRKVFNEQKRRLDRLVGKVDVVVTDSPLLLSLHYGQAEGRVLSPEFKQEILEAHHSYESLNVQLVRNPELKYEDNGRLQSLTESDKIARSIAGILSTHQVPVKELRATSHINEILFIHLYQQGIIQVPSHGLERCTEALNTGMKYRDVEQGLVPTINLAPSRPTRSTQVLSL